MSDTTDDPSPRASKVKGQPEYLTNHRIAQLDKKLTIIAGSTVDGGSSVYQDLLALNHRAVAQGRGAGSKAIRNLDKPHRWNGEIFDDIEILMFGIWLMMTGAPGLKTVQGQPADQEAVVRTITVAAFILWRRTAERDPRSKPSGPTPGWLRPGRITAAHLRDGWKILFNENMADAVLKSRRKSALRILDAYLGHMSTITVAVGASGCKAPLRSPHLETVWAALGDKATRA